MFRVVRAAGAVVLTAGLLTGCSLLPTIPQPQPTPTQSAEAAPETEAGQTAKEACDLLLPVMIDTNTRMNDPYAELQADPTKAGPLLHGISDDLHAALEQITNAEVLDVTSQAVDSLDAMIAEIDKIIAGDGDPAALLAASGAVNDDFSAIDPVCQAAG